jgi:hypothetical protein
VAAAWQAPVSLLPHFHQHGWTPMAPAPMKTPRSQAMSDPEKPDQTPTPSPSSRKAAEKQRLAEALRENLRRRKAQARGRRAETSGNSGSEGE